MASRAGNERAAQRKAAETGPVISIELEGQVYTWIWKDMTPFDVRAMREQMGCSPNQLLREARAEVELDHVAGIVWMARRQNGEPELTYAEVAGSIHYSDDWKIVSAEEAVARESDSPEA
jgi:hypothetical protein